MDGAGSGHPPDERVRRLAAHCRAVLGDLTLLRQPSDYPNSLALCALDAMWSMGVRYTAVEHVISRYREHRRSQGADPDRDSLTDLLATIDQVGSGEGLPCCSATISAPQPVTVSSRPTPSRSPPAR
jgi:hypothetical protein